MFSSAAAKLKSKSDRLRSIVSDPRTKRPGRVAQEVLAARRFGMSPGYYVERLLYRVAAGNPADYLTWAQQRALYQAKRDAPGSVRVFEDKTLFDEHFRAAGPDEGGPFPLPAYLGQTRGGRVVRANGEEASLYDPDAFGGAVAEMLAASPTGSLFAKPAIAQKGAGAYLVREGTGGDAVEALRRDVLQADYVFQGVVQQHPELARLYPHSLNTVRILVGTSASGDKPVLSAILRLGQGGRSVDNAHAGGVFVGVDRETGHARGPNGLPARGQTLYFFGGRSYDRHPDTDVPFEGYVVPHFAEAVALARRAQDRLPYLYAGWDVGITSNGPVLIEGNYDPYLLMMEVANGGFKADPVARAFLQEHGIIDA